MGCGESGLTYGAIAAQVGLSPDRGVRHLQAVCGRGREGAGQQARGRKPDEQRLLDAAQEAGSAADLPPHAGRAGPAVRPVEPGSGACGDPAALWGCAGRANRRQVLARWGFTAQKPLRRAYEQNPAAVRHWLRQEYPAIVGGGPQARGTIFWGDETGLRADDVRGRGYAPRGRTPVIRVCHRRAGLGLISAVSNRGALRWMVLDGAVNAAALIRFLQRLIREPSARCS